MKHRFQNLIVAKSRKINLPNTFSENIWVLLNNLSSIVCKTFFIWLFPLSFSRYPFLAVQHHPEKNLFEWDSGLNLAHNFLGSAYSQFIGDYFVQLCRTSCQRFDSEDQLDQFLIYNYPVTYSQNLFDNKHFTEMYLFPQNSGSL